MSVSDLISPRLRLLEQEREISQLKKEVETLRRQNDSMREGMRRCVTCEYRIDFKERQSEVYEVVAPNSSPKINEES